METCRNLVYDEEKCIAGGIGNMPTIGLSIYSLRILKLRNGEAELHNIKDGKSLIDIVRDFIEVNIKSYVDEKENENLFRFDDWDIRDEIDTNGNKLFKMIYGKIKSGSYGAEGEIVDKTTGKTTHKFTPNEAPVLPFSFCIAVPECDEGTTTGVAIFQTLSGNGIKSIFDDYFKTYVKKIDIGLTVSFGALYPKEFIKSYMRDGRLAKINMIQYCVPNDIADRIGMDRGVKRSRQIMTITNPIGFVDRNKYKIEECLQGKRPYDKIVEFPDFDYDDLKLVFNVGGKNKTISMKNIEKTIVSEDITKRVSKDGGNPEKESIIMLFEEYSRDYLMDMGIIIAQDGIEYKLEIQQAYRRSEEKENEINSGDN